MSKTDLHSSLLFLMIKLEEAKNNSMSDKNFVAALTDVLRYFRDNGELKKAYEIQKGSLTNMANSPWAKLVIGMLTSKVQEDKVDVELPDIDALIKENTSDEFIERIYSPVLPFPTNEMAFNDFIYNVKYFTGNKYLVTGDLLDETGTDGEPLIKNVKILKKL